MAASFGSEVPVSTFSRLFGGHAPFEALQEHMKVVLECVVELEPLFDALVVSDEAEMKAVAKRIFVAESKADDLRDALRLHLPRSLFMPIDRRDLLDLLRVQDEMGNITEDVAGSLLRRDMTPPEAMFDDVVALAHEVVEVVRIAAELVALFDELVEVGFRGRMAERVEGIISRLDAARDRRRQARARAHQPAVHPRGRDEPCVRDAVVRAAAAGGQRG